jgi:hypothetical protein
MKPKVSKTIAKIIISNKNASTNRAKSQTWLRKYLSKGVIFIKIRFRILGQILISDPVFI